MKWVIIFWALPIAILGTWYGLSYYDMNFGFVILSRPMHDLVFQIYGNILGIPPEDIPLLVVRALMLDTVLLVLVMAYRRRARIMAWWRARQEKKGSPEAALAIDDNLSSAP